MGKKPAAMAPSRTMTIEMTNARTGRSMKKRASMTVLQRVRGEWRGVPGTTHLLLLPEPARDVEGFPGDPGGIGRGEEDALGCAGDDGDLTLKPSRHGDAPVDGSDRW